MSTLDSPANPLSRSAFDEQYMNLIKKETETFSEEN